MYSKKYGFTLAETLITLVIFGIISAITIPVCIDNYKRQSVPVKLKKFYSNMNNALRLWYTESGNYAGTYSFEEGDIRKAQPLKKFYESSIGKYLIDIKEPEISGNNICAAFNDGSGFCGYIA